MCTTPPFVAKTAIYSAHETCLFWVHNYFTMLMYHELQDHNSMQRYIWLYAFTSTCISSVSVYRCIWFGMLLVYMIKHRYDSNNCSFSGSWEKVCKALPCFIVRGTLSIHWNHALQLKSGNCILDLIIVRAQSKQICLLSCWEGRC